MGCSSSNLPISSPPFNQNKRGGPGNKNDEEPKNKTDEMSTLTVPKIVKKDDKSKPASNIPIGSSTGNPRNKVALMPGRSMIDWMKYHKNAPDPSGTGGKMLRITKEELTKHNKEDDCWIALNGRVYNVTPYMEYHPGGISEMMRGAGINGTDLFNEVHRWVNYESMLKRCCVGFLDATPSNLLDFVATSSDNVDSKSFKPPQDKTKKPRYSWSQNNDSVTITISTFYDNIRRHHVTVDVTDLDLLVNVIVKDHIFVIDIKFEAMVSQHYKIVESQSESGEVDIVFNKKVEGKFWSVIGSPNKNDCQWKAFSVADLTFRSCRLVEKRKLTHDVCFFKFQLPSRSFCVTPVGCHFFIRTAVDGFDITKPYTSIPPSLLHKTSDDDDDDGSSICFMIKIYKDGILTPVLDKLKESDSLNISTTYTGNSFETKFRRLKSCHSVVLLAAGTGITPMTSLLNDLSQEDVTTVERSVHLLFLNKSEEDIVWREEFEEFAVRNKWFTFISILSQPSKNWKGLTGKIGKKLLTETIGSDKNESRFYCVCGPTPFMECAVNLVRDLQVPESHIHAFTE